MREIKFRAWDKKLKKWVNPDAISITLSGTPMAPDETWMEHNLADLALMQFTGLHDRNGKEIWEGDIFIVKNVHDGDEYIWGEGKPIPQTVTWDKVGFEFGNSTRIVYAPYDFEVIGNVYENAELLK